MISVRGLLPLAFVALFGCKSGPASPKPTVRNTSAAACDPLLTKLVGRTWKDVDGEPIFRFRPDGSATRVEGGTEKSFTYRAEDCDPNARRIVLWFGEPGTSGHYKQIEFNADDENVAREAINLKTPDGPFGLGAIWSAT